MNNKKKNVVPVVFTSSAYYAPYMAVTLQSLLDCAKEENFYDIIILNKEISQEDQEKIKEMVDKNPNTSVRFIEVSQALDAQNYNFREGYSPESFYRVVMVELLTEYDRVVYLDSDLILLEDIADLYFGTDIEDNLVAAAIDIDGLASAFSNHDGRKDYMISYMGISNLHDYFQSGVMIFNLKEWRKTFSLEQILDAACQPEIMFGDQDVLNVLCRGRIKFIDMSWNTIINHRRKQMRELLCLAPVDLLDDYFEARKTPKIIHYGGTKPWDVPDCDMAWLFWEKARKTTFYDEIIKRVLPEFERGKYGLS